ncbi:sporulation protein YpjB [Virgibacillus halophilus]|uniref:sporulation protein YpjB n=1 Tax=Tigheibacillus halophilus TaxID=361280 RepID=UPI00363EB3F1
MKKFSTRSVPAAMIIGILTLFIHTKVYAAAEAGSKGTQMSVFYWIICIVGGCIALTLTYVSWRKYEAEAKKKKNEDHSVD